MEGDGEGPAFRGINRHGRLSSKALSNHSIALVIKRALMAGEIANGASAAEAMTASKFAGHSLRAGLATSAAFNDTADHLIQAQLRHKKLDTTMKYIRAGELFKKNAAGMVGL